MTLIKSLVATTLLISAITTPALARVYNEGVYQGGAAAAQYNYQRFGETGYARDGDIRNTCVKMCRRDSNPCDPPEFKRADGRCQFPFD